MELIYDLNNVSFTYPNNTAFILNAPDLKIYAGEIIGIVGKNGVGKTTLLKLLALLTQPTSGNLYSLYDRKQITLLLQQPYLLKRSVYHNLIYGLKIRGKHENLEGEARKVLQQAGLPENILHKNTHHLSQGERQRIALAMRLILKPQVLLLDEPTANIDISSQNKITELLPHLKITTVIASHDQAWLQNLTKRIIILP